MQKRAEKGNQLFQLCSCALTLLCSGCIESENNNRVDAEHERQMESKDFNQLFLLCFARWGSAVLNMEQGCTGRRSIEEMQSTWANMVLVPELNGDLLLWAGEPKPAAPPAACFCTIFNPGDPFVQLSTEFLFSIKHFRFTVDQAVSGHFERRQCRRWHPRNSSPSTSWLHLLSPPSCSAPSFEFATKRPLSMVATSHRARDISNVFIARSPQTKSRWSTNLNWQLWPFLVDQNQSRNLKQKLNLPKYWRLDDTAYMA